MPFPFLAASATEATSVPWPCTSSSGKVTVSGAQVAQRAIRLSNVLLSGEMRPANSALLVAMPVSMTAMVTPLPVMPLS